MQTPRALIVDVPSRAWNYEGEAAVACDGATATVLAPGRVLIEGDSVALRPRSADGSVREVTLDRFRRCVSAAESGTDPWATPSAARDAAAPTPEADVSSPRTDAARPADRDGKSAPGGGRRVKRKGGRK